MKLTRISLGVMAACTIFTPFLANSAGLSMSQLATTKSVATAGAANVTNSSDSSATISNAAALSGIEERSYVSGAQYTNVFNQFTRDDTGESTEASKGLIAPHASYAKRLNEESVFGISLHSAGGLGVEYSNGVGANPINAISENAITVVDITSGISYAINDKLSLGASLILQYMKVDVIGGMNTQLEELATGDSIAPSFALSTHYELSDSTHLGMQYRHKTDHEIDVDTSLDINPTAALSWVTSVDMGLKHQLSEQTALMVNAKFENWEDHDDKYTWTYSVGLGAEHKLDKLTIYGGASYDSSPVSENDRDVLLPVDEQWRIGFGGEYELESGNKLGLAYQYQNNGTADISANNGLLQPTGSYEDNRIHFVTVSYRH
ncbi:outer membrane protein transport protein [Photobacterium sp. SDRW27]|uniref:OmpP1/FadL family transporter n=1 Tax=Photobacterium obscurum TaxID=2829490 RepID=UPI002244A6A9|nr:outer membrane protein transport protein [Photobacterium obscurum]MCW8332175.1 outer membrane protein transport protein [Photobacterium obscurum]